jgi:exonuclease III
MIDAKLLGNRVTLVAVYGPNRDDPTFYQSLQSKIEIIGNTSVIIGDYWNVPLNYEIDTENYVNKNNPKAQQKIQALMAELDLLDVWRKNNPSVKHYSWRGPNRKRSRLHFLLVSSDLETFVINSDICVSYGFAI